MLNKFPINSLLPKNETGAKDFLSKYPQYNGTGVTIAIFDTDIDPRAAGLKTNPDGTVKVIERFDCSGCGDVDISKTVSMINGTITGLSGRTLKISEQMKKDNINGHDFRVGLKNLNDLYAKEIQENIAAHFRVKYWDENQAKAVAEVSQNLRAFNLADCDQQLSFDQKLRKSDCTEALEFFKNFEKNYSELKKSLDCVVYETADHWCAVIDVTETGDLENALHLAEYSKSHEIKRVDDFLAMSINIHDDGNVLEIVGINGSHGTHVAAIAAGNNGNSELDGIAPGAKIVSLTISNNRLGIIETGTSLVRAMIKVIEMCEAGRRVHIINMSFSKYVHWLSDNRIGDLMAEVINKYGVIWVTSAGNVGPALCTIGTPPNINHSTFIGVGAYVSGKMMEAEYALRETLPGNVYTFTSRDPCVDGGQGVTVCAPGGAIASVPEFTFCKEQLKNGTSMSSPQVAGCIALILSGLLNNKIPYSPFSVKRAICNAATKLDNVDRFAQGNGLLNVPKTFDHLIKFKNSTENNILFSIKCGSAQTRGILIRKGNPSVEEHAVTVTPIFLNELEVDAKQKINFNIRLTLTASQPWVQVGSYLDLNYVKRTFLATVDPSALTAGVHTSSIKAYDTANIDKGILFEVPITVVKPIFVENNTISFDLVSCQPNTILRHFIYVPKNATWAVLKLKSLNSTYRMPAKYCIHTVQLLAFRKTMLSKRFVSVSKESQTIHTFKCQENNVLEVCIAKLWSNLGESMLEASIEFKGIRIASGSVMNKSNGIHSIDLLSLRTKHIHPRIQLNATIMVLKPIESKLSPLGVRDIIPAERQLYENVFTFKLTLAKSHAVAFYSPLLNDYLYESPFDSQFWMLFDANKMMVGCGDAYTSGEFLKLQKGDYVLRLQVRHDNREMLDALSEIVMLAKIKLETAILLDIYSSYKEAILNGTKCESTNISAETLKTIYVAPMLEAKLTKLIPKDCSWLEGSFTYSKEELCHTVDNSPFKYILTEGPMAKKPDATKNDNETDKFKEYLEGLRDYQNSMIAKLDKEQAETVYKEIIEAHPAFLDVHISMIQKLESPELKNHLPFSYRLTLAELTDLDKAKVELNRILDLANVVINETDSNALLAYYGLKVDSRTDATKIKKNMDGQKNALLEAYRRKTIVLSKVHLIESLNKDSVTLEKLLTALDSIYEEVGKFIEYTDSKVLSITVWHSFAHQQYGRMANALYKLYADRLEKDVLVELKRVSVQMKWNHIVTGLDKMIVSANPANYSLF